MPKFRERLRIEKLTSAASAALDILVNGDSESRIKVDAGGKVTWGDGSTTGDTNLYRDGADVLKTDDTFKAVALFVDNIELDPTGAVNGNALVFDGTKFAPGEGGGGGASISISDTTPSSPTAGDLWYESDTGSTFVYYDSYWVEVGGIGVSGGVENLSGLSDVTLTSPTNGQVLKYNGTAWVNAADDAGTTIASLGDIDDVTITSPSAGNVLLYESGGWINLDIGSVANAGIDLADIADVIITDASSGDFIKWNGSNWVNETIDLGTDTSGNYVSDITAGTGVTVTHTPGEGSSAEIAIGQDVGTTADVEFNSLDTGTIKNGTSSSQSPIEINASSLSINTGDVLYSDTGSVAIGGSLFVTGDISGVLSVGTTAIVFEGDTDDDFETIIQATDPTADRTITFPDASGTVALGQSVGTTDNVQFNDVTVSGNLTVSGTTTTLNTENLLVEDNIVVLNSGVTASPTLDAGIEVERGTRQNVSLFWDEEGTSGRWRVYYEYTDGGMTNTPIALEGVTQLNNLAGVFYEAVSSGQVLTHDGTNWVPQTPVQYNPMNDSQFSAIITMDIGV